MKEKSEGMITQRLAASLLPRRAEDAHKGDFGRALVIAGSQRYPGAARLALLAALRSGAGLVYGAIPESIYLPLAASIAEAIWLLLPGRDGDIASETVGVIPGMVANMDSVLIGPGLGQNPGVERFLIGLLSYLSSELSELPLVIDADALNLLSRVDGWQELLPPGCLLTPHEMEFSRLSGLDMETIRANRPALAKKWAQKWKQTLILKGPNTIVASPEGELRSLPFANSALAHGGSGDVLAGLTVGLLAQAMDPFNAAALAVWLHARAAGLAMAEIGHAAAVLPSDLINYFGKAMAELA